MIIDLPQRSKHAKARIASGAAALLSVLFLGAPPGFALCDTSGMPRPGPAAGRQAVLTFDAAWLSDGAEGILDVLGESGVSATFFLAGRFVREHPGIARRIVGEGHEVGNHTFTHSHLTHYADNGSRASLPGVTRASLGSELDSARAEFESATGAALAPLWRAPYGEVNTEILAWARKMGYTHVGWSSGLDTLDWVSDPTSRLYRSPAAAARRVLRLLAARDPREGPAVLLMHLGSERPPAERFANELPWLIREARRIGYTFVTASRAMHGGRLP